MKLVPIVLTICSLTLALKAAKPFDNQSRGEPALVKPTSLRTAADPVTNPASKPATFSKWELYTSVTIPAGQTVNLDSSLDYSSSDTVRVTVRSAKADLLALLGTAYFTVPDATEYLTQEAFLGSDFFYGNSGGVTFQVCGSQFRLALRNTGTVAITLSSVLVYTHVL